MSPIRIGFIGLSSSQSWATWSHLHYLKSSPKYTITALCNSSVESAQAAIEAHGLDSTTKAYGSPKDLAEDPEVDLIVCSVQVPKHYETIMPALKAGKDVFCEWPLARNLAEAEEITALAKSKGVRTMVGLQAQVSPALNTIKRIVDSGKIGKVLSTTFHGTPKFFGAKEWEGMAYTHDKENGANLLTIYAMHSLESITHVLGPIQSYTPVLAVQQPTSQFTDFSGKVTSSTTRTAHDQILLQGTLESNAVLSYHLRGGPAFANSPTSALFWRIYGEKGEIQVTGPDTYLQTSDDNVEIEVFEHESGKTEKVDVPKDALRELPLFARNVGKLYEGFAEGKGVGEGILDFGEAVKRHEFIEGVYRLDGERKVKA